MQTLGIVGMKNVTVTTFSSDYDRMEADKVAASPKATQKKSEIMAGVTAKNMRGRFAKQGALEVRYYPIS